MCNEYAFRDTHKSTLIWARRCALVASHTPCYQLPPHPPEEDPPPKTTFTTTSHVKEPMDDAMELPTLEVSVELLLGEVPLGLSLEPPPVAAGAGAFCVKAVLDVRETARSCVGFAVHALSVSEVTAVGYLLCNE